jgi:hypothetical protein
VLAGVNDLVDRILSGVGQRHLGRVDEAEEARRVGQEAHQ